MKRILIISSLAFTFMFAGVTVQVSSVTPTETGYEIQLDYISDELVGGYQFDFLSNGSLELTGAAGGASDVFDGLTTGNNIVLSFSFSGATLPVTSEYTHLVTLSATVNEGFDGASVLLEARECSGTQEDNIDCLAGGEEYAGSRLIFSNATGSDSIASEFLETTWTVGSDWDGTLDNDSMSPIVFSLGANYPNPFNPSTSIEYSIAELGLVNLSIFDATGRLVKTLVSENKNVGSYIVSWDGTNNNGINASAGIYLYKIKTGSFIETKKMLLVK